MLSDFVLLSLRPTDTTKFDAQSHVENIKGASAPTSKEQAKSEGEEAVEHLRVLAKLVFTNSEVRKLLSDITVLGRDVAAGEFSLLHVDIL